MITLFPDQVKVKNELRLSFAKGYSRPLVVAPCGFGKGTLAADIIHEAVAKGNRIWFLVNRRTLVHDMVKRLRRLGLNPGVMMGAQTRGTHLDCLVVSVGTLRNRLDRVKLPELAFIDEAHEFMSAESEKFVKGLSKSGVKIILMTATPWCLNRRGLGRIADTMIEGPPADVLIHGGRLARPVVYAPSVVDMEDAKKTSAGEFDEEDAAARFSTKKLIGDIVAHWKDLAFGRKTAGFAVNCKTATEYADAFNAAGIPAVTVDANTPDKEREKIWVRLARGEVMVWSVGVISYGWDVPEVDCIIDAAPTMSLSKAMQKWGRVIRFHKDKKDGLILDHAGNTLRHGLPDDPRDWTLRDRAKRMSDEAKAKILPLPQVCPKCAAVVRGAVCQCGYKFAGMSGNGMSAGRKMDVDTSAKLERVESRVYIYPDTTGDVSKDALIGIAASKGYKPGWIHHQSTALEAKRAEYRSHFGDEPKSHWKAGQLQGMIDGDKQRRKVTA